MAGKDEDDKNEDFVVYDETSIALTPANGNDDHATSSSSQHATSSYPPSEGPTGSQNAPQEEEEDSFANTHTPTSARIGASIMGLFSPSPRRGSSWKGKARALDAGSSSAEGGHSTTLFSSSGGEGDDLEGAGSAARHSTESLTFSYRDHLLPLSLSLSTPGAAGGYDDDEYDIDNDDGDSAYEMDFDGDDPGGGGKGKYQALEVEEEAEEEQALVSKQDGTPSTASIQTGSQGKGKKRGGLIGNRRRSRRRGERADVGVLVPLERRMTLIDGISLTVGLQIGSGIFSSPGVVTLNAGSVGASLLIWLSSGVLAWTGASSFAELGSAIPLNGGAQAYLNYSLGPLAAYLFAWTAITALKPGSGAIISIIFGEYIARVLFHANLAGKAYLKGGSGGADQEGGKPAVAHPHEQGLQDIPQWSIKLIALSVTVLISLLQSLSNKLGTRLQNTTTIIKLLSLAAVPVLAIVTAARHKMPEESVTAFSSLPAFFKGSAVSPGAYALALYSGLWSFDGWDQASYVAGEMKNVKRDLPRVINVSLAVVLVIFLATVTSYFVVLPPALVARTNTVALDYGSVIFGSTGGIIFALLVAFSCFGALNSQFYTTARLVYVAGREGYLPKLFGKLSRRRKTPVYALILQNVLVAFFVLFGSGFASLVNFYGVCSWLFYFATVCGLLVLRVTEPNLERPYKTWLTTPILFATVALFLLLMPIFSAPLEALAAFCFISAGVPMYFITQRRQRAGAGSGGGVGGKSDTSSWLSRLFGGRGGSAASARESEAEASAGIMMTEKGGGG